MDRTYATSRFWTVLCHGGIEGWTGLELWTRTSELFPSLGGQDERRVAMVTFWDATGQFGLETFGTEVSLEIVEELIAEAKDRIKVR
jgi:hypothetical protein